MAQRQMMPFVLYVIAFALGIASFIISVLSAAPYTTIGALLSIAVFCLGFAGVSSSAGMSPTYSRSGRPR